MRREPFRVVFCPEFQGRFVYDAPRRCWWVSSSKARKFSHEFSSVARNALWRKSKRSLGSAAAGAKDTKSS